MFNQSKNRKLSLFLLVFVLACATGVGAATPPPQPPPPTVTITDNFGSSHGNFIRWDRFSTDLSAAIQNPPQTTQETTITGPTYNWAVVSQNPSSPTFSIVDSGNGNATLQSPIASKSVCFVAGGGTYDVKVNCTITYTSTDNKTGVATPLGFSSQTPLDVTFFVRIPYNVVANGNVQHSVYPNNTGHQDIYSLQLQDNEATPQAYGNGLIHETFSNAKDANGQSIPDTALNPGGADDWGFVLDGNGYATGTGSSLSNFQDVLSDSTTTPMNPNQLEDTFDQPWYCIELTPPYNAPGANLYVRAGVFHMAGNGSRNNPQLGDFLSNVNLTPLSGGHGSVHHVVDYYGESYRSYPGHSAY